MSRSSTIPIAKCPYLPSLHIIRQLLRNAGPRARQHVARINFRRLGKCRPSPSSPSPLFSPTHRQSSNVNHHPSALFHLGHEPTSFYGRLAGRSLPLMAFRQSFYIADIGRQYSGSPFRLPLFRSVGQLPSHKSVLKSDITFNLSRQHETAVRP